MALQIGGRERQSDAYALLPFLADATISGYLATLLQVGLKEALKYSLKTVLESLRRRPQISGTINTDSVDSSVLTGAIYGDMVKITNHINNVGNVEKLYLIPAGGIAQTQQIVFDAVSRDYVRSLSSQVIGRGSADHRTCHATACQPAGC